MALNHYLAFLVVSFFTVATPGPTTLFLIRQAAVPDVTFKSLAGAVAGILLADILFMASATFGFSQIFLNYPGIATTLQWCSTFYFLRLSFLVLSPYVMKKMQYPVVDTSFDSTSANRHLNAPGPAFMRTFTMHCLNIKAWLFFGMLIPRFTTPELMSSNHGIPTLFAIHVTTAAAVLFTLCYLGTFLKRLPSIGRLIDIGSGCVFLVLAGSRLFLP